MLRRPNKAETAANGFHSPGDMVGRMREVLARPWLGVSFVCLFVSLFCFERCTNARIHELDTQQNGRTSE